MSDLELMAYMWWRSKRPALYDVRDHLKWPAVNCIGDTPEERLALEVAKRLEHDALELCHD